MNSLIKTSLAANKTCEAIIASGLPLITLRVNNEAAVIMLSDSATPEQKLQAQTICDTIFPIEMAKTNQILGQEDAKREFNSLESNRLERAITVLFTENDNELRQWLVALKSAAATASSFLELKAKIALLPSLPNITAEQVETAILSKIDAGQLN